MLTPGQAHDLAGANALVDSADPEALIGDKAFDADPFIAKLTARAITPPLRQTRPKFSRRSSAGLRYHPAQLKTRPNIGTTVSNQPRP